MEASSEGEKKKKKKPSEGENKTKRKMKSAFQLEVLEKTYAVDAYPPENVRAELSEKLGLSDRQLQMWFCHRRLKDKKTPAAAVAKKLLNDSPAGTAMRQNEEEILMDAMGNEYASVSGSGSSPFGRRDSRKNVPRHGMGTPRSGGELPAMKRFSEPRQFITQLRAIAFVESQLGEPLREDGPILGMEFDPLPPDAFGAPIGAMTMGQQRLPGRPFEAKIYEGPDAKSNKGISRAPHEYQFLPEKPTVRTELYERVPLYHYGSPDDIPHSRNTSLSTACSLLNKTDTVPSGYGFPGHMPGLNILPQQGRQGHTLSSASGEFENVPQKSSFVNTVNTFFGAHPITQIDNPFIPSEKRLIHEEELARLDRKRKSEEARVQREIEAHEKRIRKELEKQDILRRKREEQIRKEMERQERERRKEEERMLRERQREEERYQREQKRELERRERFLQKESIRAEKMRQKEELRREREAARMKAANERAIARRIARESMELIEDERLELMELAVSKKGLSSILSLDYDMLQNLDIYGEMRASFPPKSVQLKKPFSVQPWSDAEDNVAKLLMVWKFLITFADVLGIWSFTLDEFVQSFHDHDPRLLGEIHIALLRSIIKDIEDVTRTPAVIGANQSSAANPGGGHPQIVEGAYAWGFDIRNWQRHLNQLTWPEMLRQLALSAGFGPQLKKMNIEQAYPGDDNEGKDGKDVISNLRNGAAVENALAIMQERGFSNPRRSRHRLTPGTVKFAAFHVLSLEGSKGLTILEVAERIQKSGLRDLTTSKTPEASISAALSRDTKLFERVAPSTYCVRPPYRKDPADAEAILSAARERMRMFKSGMLEAEPDDAEKDEDSESDVAEDPELDDLAAQIHTKEVQNSEQLNAKPLLRNRRDNDEILQNPYGGPGNACDNLSIIQPDGFDEVKNISASNANSTEIAVNDKDNLEQEDPYIDVRSPCEPWVQGLAEGEYSDLSVEERLDALVALISVANEGNSIRVVLEDRLEAANALKKQMWAGAQLDKRRLREECFVKMHYSPGNKNETNIDSVEVKPGPLRITNVKNGESLIVSEVQQEKLNDQQSDQNNLHSFPFEGNSQSQNSSAVVDNLPLHPPGYAAEKSRSHLKSYVGQLAEEIYVYRSLPLGSDRRRNRYWQFMASPSQNDPGCGRVFVELQDGIWRLIDTEEGFDALLASLDARGVRESHLLAILQRIEISFKESARKNVLYASVDMREGDCLKEEAVEIAADQNCGAGSGSSSPAGTVCVADSDISGSSKSFTIQLGRNKTEKRDVLKRYQDFERWMWKECIDSSTLCAMKLGKERCTRLLSICDSCHDVFLSEENCPYCYETCSTLKRMSYISEHMVHAEEKISMSADNAFHCSLLSPLRMRLLKMLLSFVEASIPPEALQPLWTESHRKSWGVKLQSSSSAEDLLQLLTALEDAIKRDYLSSDHETTRELLASSGCPSFSLKEIPVLPWVPNTTAAVGQRLMELDASLFYTLQQKEECQRDRGNVDLTMLTPKLAPLKNSCGSDTLETSHQFEHPYESWVDLVGGGYSKSGRKQGSHNRACRDEKSQKSLGSITESGKKINVASGRRLGPVVGWKRKPRRQGGHRCGLRSIRSRQKQATKVRAKYGKGNTQAGTVVEDAPAVYISKEQRGDESVGLRTEYAENDSWSERLQYEDENGQQEAGCEFDDMEDNEGGYDGSHLDGKYGNVIEDNDYNVEDDEEEEEEDINDDEDEDEGDLDVEGCMNGDLDLGENRNTYADQNMDPDDGMTSSEYSD